MKLSNKILKIWKPVRALIIVVFSLGLISFVNNKQAGTCCSSVEVHIKNQLKNYFINEADIMSIITDKGTKQIVGTPFSELSLKTLETKLYASSYIQHAEVFRDIKGSLMINIDQSRPIARMISSRMKDRYIGADGTILPLSDRYTARVVLIDGAFADNLKTQNIHDIPAGKGVMKLLRFINRDEFWRAQIAQLHIDKKGHIQMLTQVSKQIVDFGRPENIEQKFRNLKIFYKEILPAKGWNSYKKVSVKFKDQIVCE